MISIKAKNGASIECDKHASSICTMIKAQRNSNSNELSSLKDIEPALVNKIVVYLNYHAKTLPLKIPDPAPDDLSAAVGTWDADYIDELNVLQCFELMLTADHMGCPDLVNLAAAKVAVTLRNKSLEEGKALYRTVQSTRNGGSAKPVIVQAPCAPNSNASISSKLSYIRSQAGGSSFR